MKGPLGKTLTAPDTEDKDFHIRTALSTLRTTGKPLRPEGKGGDSPFKSVYGNRGSSRLYLGPLRGSTNVMIDGEPTKVSTGVKVVASNEEVDRMNHFIKKSGKFSHDSLGQMQMAAENNDGYVNDRYRVLTKTGKRKYKTNKDGIFPPLIDYDHHNHEWAHVGHAEPLSFERGHPNNFQEVTKTESHPEGLKLGDFHRVLLRAWDRDNGRYRPQSPEREEQLDRAESHPLAQNFLNHQREMGAPPHDFHEDNLAVWTHPHTRKKHIVAIDHGFSKEVSDAYKYGRKQYGKYGTRHSSGSFVSNPSGSGSRTKSISEKVEKQQYQPFDYYGFPGKKVLARKSPSSSGGDAGGGNGGGGGGNGGGGGGGNGGGA